MSRKIISQFLLVGLILGATSIVKAQNANDAFRYSSQYPGGGATSMAMPGSGIASEHGLASTLDNPASAALFSHSGTFFGYSFRNISETGTYLGAPEENSETHNSLANIGFSYKMPTRQGSFVFGAGYVQNNDFDRSLEAEGFNERSSITDMFNQSDFYGDAAYNAFAIDSINNRTQSVLRFGGFRGIRQDVQILESGQMGELTGFLGTEYQKNLFVGVSLNMPLGSYTYEQTFIEQDSRNEYTVDGSNYDVDRILSRDVIEANIVGFRARVGMIYRNPENFNIGINYQFRSVLTVDEDYRTFIETTFDNNDFFDDKFTGEVRYKVESPARLSAGIAIASINRVTITASGEWVNYSNMKMKWADEDIDLTDTHFRQENDFIEDTYRSVINLEGGVSYQFTNVVRPYLGYAYYPAPSENSDADRSFLSGGVNLGRERELNVNIGVQYAMWNDQLILYEYEDSSGSFITESAREEVRRLQVIVGVSYRF